MNRIALAVLMSTVLVAAAVQAAEVPAPRAKWAKQHGDPNWRAKGLHCNPSSWITAEEARRRGKNPAPGLAYVCP